MTVVFAAQGLGSSKGKAVDKDGELNGYYGQPRGEKQGVKAFEKAQNEQLGGKVGQGEMVGRSSIGSQQGLGL